MKAYDVSVTDVELDCAIEDVEALSQSGLLNKNAGNILRLHSLIARLRDQACLEHKTVVVDLREAISNG